MKNLHLPFIIIIAVLFVGCGNENRYSNPYIIGKKPVEKHHVVTMMPKRTESPLEVAKLEAETEKEIALINKTRDLELKQMEEETKILALKRENELAVKEHNLSTLVYEQKFAFKNDLLWIAALALIAFFALSFYIFKKIRQDRLKMHEESLQKEVYLREKELQVKMAEKILETIASGHLSEERAGYLLEKLENNAAPKLPNS